MELNPQVDTQIDRYALDEESANISHLLYLYDTKWDFYNRLAQKLEKQIKNLEDNLKLLRQQLFVKAKTNWGICGFDKSPSDKLAEAYPYTVQEYITMHDELLEKRLEYAEAQATSSLYQNHHYQLLDKSKNIDTLKFLWSAQYFSTENSSPNGEPENSTKEVITQTRRTKKEDTDFTQTMSQRMTRRRTVNED